ncbi:MAG TPA: type IV secretion system DNA-binding domain-containing protein [Methylotenera sp.]|nr:type IV secretion system DNA-binding domain-containing protein [Methylotenera sp.]HPH06094.1 type IV secretion system DNA-binding domain-containing protein [Methylotenera sp.]
MKIRYISSPKQDSILAPSEYRRYTNHIISFNIFFTVLFYSLLTYILFYKIMHIDYLKSLILFLNNDTSIDRLTFKLSTLFLLSISIAVSYFLTNIITKPTNRQTIKSGNYIDDTENVIENIEKNFKNVKDKTIAFLKEGDTDFNKLPYKKLLNTIYLPENIKELSTVITGEAGSGKTVLTDRMFKEVIDNKHKLIVHNVKGDELSKLDGYTKLYLIEPWNKQEGYSIDFLNLISSEVIQNENSRIRTFVLAFTEAISKTDFFQIGSISVIETFVRYVVRETKVKGIVKGNLGDIVEKWNSFNIQPIDTNLLETNDTSINKLKEELDKNKEQLDLINAFISIYNPTASVYINSQNAKTSLCVLASCIDIIRKFETLSSFWGDKQKNKALNIRKWIADKDDRQAIVLSNSNTYSDIANCYISAFINLIVPELIDNSYKPTSQIHFILDEFPQLSSISLDTFMKLPDVGRSKQIRTTVILQRASQIKEKFQSNGKPADSKSFMASFQNKVICRFASDDIEYVKEIIGEQDIIEYSTTSNFTATGQTFSNKTNEKRQPAYNINELNNLLGPQFDTNNKFIGVRILFKFSQNNTLPLIIMPTVSFPKKLKKITKSITSNNIKVNLNKSITEEDKELETVKEEVIEIQQEIETIHNEASDLDFLDDINPIANALEEQLAHSIDPSLSIASAVGDMIDNFTSKNTNNNITLTNELKTTITKKKDKELEI